MKSVLLLISSLAFSVTLLAQSDAVRAKNFNVKKNLAIDGYDPVSYFKGKPIEGKPQFKFTHHGVTYHFVNQDNLTAFKGSPDKYEPAYGGWCAFAMGDTGEKVKIDPETYKIVDGKLYLFYNFWLTNTLEDWNNDELKLKTNADKNWAKIVK
jgi:YHS domain-containing protein